jgi:hypothetical protein
VIVVLLVVIWGIALVPVTMRWISERQVTTSVARFMSARRNLRRSYPVLAVVESDSGRVTSAAPRRAEAASPAALRHRRAQARRRAERRRRVLTTLASATAATVVFGALPPLHLLWAFSGLGIVLIAGYCLAIARMAQNESAMVQPRRTVVEPPSHVTYEALLVANGQARSAAGGAQRRPSFVLVDAPS